MRVGEPPRPGAGVCCDQTSRSESEAAAEPEPVADLSSADPKLAAACFDPSGQPDSDTDQSDTNQTVAPGEAVFRKVFLEAPVAMLLLDSQQRICGMNHTAERSLGGPSGAIQGRCFGSAVGCVRAADDPRGCGAGPECPNCPVRRLVVDSCQRGRFHHQVEVKLQTGAGSSPDFAYYLVSTAPLALAEGRGVVVCIEDINLRKQAEFELKQALDEVKRLKECLERDNVNLREEILLRYQHEEIIGESAAIRAVLRQVEQVAVTDSTVLICGETGSGKELLARAIHRLSGRRDRPMLTVNCAALPPTLVEGELFGREEGAYTGALSKQAGRFEVADGSTMLLDEVAELPLELQAKLLRVLETGQFERLGSSQTIRVDVRMIAATNRDLEEAVRKGRFRQDLYHRLTVFPINVPPLRERPEDIPLLVWAFVQEFSQRMGKIIETIPRKTMEALRRYPWPGNVRELRNVIERAMILTRGPCLHVEVPSAGGGAGVTSDLTLRDVERRHILQVLERTGWRIRGNNGAAELLGLKPTTLESRMRRLGIRRAGRSHEI